MSKRELPERFNANINKTKRCWLWTGATDSKGYGKISVDSSGRLMSAHRLSYIFKYGKILDGAVETCFAPRSLHASTNIFSLIILTSYRQSSYVAPIDLELADSSYF